MQSNRSHLLLVGKQNDTTNFGKELCIFFFFTNHTPRYLTKKNENLCTFTELMCPPPPPNLCWTPTPQCAHIWRWAFERQSGHEGGGLMNRISAPIKQSPESSSLSTMWGPQTGVCELGGRRSPDTKSSSAFILHFPASTTVRNKCSIFTLSSL